MKKVLLILFLASLCFSNSASLKLQSDIVQYLRLDVKKKNPFEKFKPLGDHFGIPLPSLKNDKTITSNFQVQSNSSSNQDINFETDYLLNKYVVGSGLKKISTLLSDYILERLRNNDKDVIHLEIYLDGTVAQEENGIGGDVNLAYRMYKDKINTLEFLGGINRNPITQMWSGSYGAKHRIQHQSLNKLYFEQSLIQNDDLIDERTWRYGLGYSPFSNFIAYVERENNKEGNDSTAAGIKYKITF